jgi:hypothetical protein
MPYSPSPSGRGRGEGRREAWRRHAGAILPYVEMKTAIGGCIRNPDNRSTFTVGEAQAQTLSVRPLAHIIDWPDEAPLEEGPRSW